MSRRVIRSRGGRAVTPPEINLTPMIDVVFVILIMFIVVAPLLELDRVELARAPVEQKRNTLSVQESGPITIHVNKDNKVMLNNQTVTLDQLPGLLRMQRESYPDVNPQLFHDREAYFGTYQEVKNAVEGAGFTQVDVILKPN